MSIGDETARHPHWLSGFSRNEFSQFGEDGIIEKIFEVLGIRSGWCVEFGAWDGKHLSNTYNLITNRGFSGVLIEGDGGRFVALKRTYRDNPNAVLVNKFVGFSGGDSLDALLRGTPLPADFELLSIDIDGNDYHVWDSLKAYRPRVVVIEYNPTVPNAVDFVQPADMTVNRGSGVASMVRLGRSKGYELVATTACNAFFVDGVVFDRFGIGDNSLAALRPDGPVTYLSQGYDGALTVHGPTTLYWHEFPFAATSLQVLPRFLRKHPGCYSRPERLLFRVYKLWFRLWKLRGD